MQKSFPIDWHLMESFDLPEDSFVIQGKSHNVPCVFQIWEKLEFQRWIPEIAEPKGYIFTKKTENPDFSLRRVGVYAGKIDSDIDKSEQSHYFIKLDEGDEKFIGKYEETINFEHNNTVGPKSISKQEFIQELNELF